jgi:hypothetical protein
MKREVVSAVGCVQRSDTHLVELHNTYVPGQVAK